MVGTTVFASAFHATLIGVLVPAVGFYALMISRIGHASLMTAMMPSASAYMAGITLLTPLWVAAGLAAVTAIFVVYFLLESPHKPIITARVENRLRYTDKRIVPFLIVGVLMFMGMAMVQQTLAFRFQDVLNLTAVETAQTFGLAMPLLIVSFACMAVADGKAMLMGAMVLQGASMGIAGSCGPLGFTIGPLLGGFMYQIEPSLPYKFTLVVYIPLFFFVLWINRRLIRR